MSYVKKFHHYLLGSARVYIRSLVVFNNVKDISESSSSL